MLDKILAKIITTLLGKYIEIDKIHVPIWKGVGGVGEISLENLTLNKDAFSFPNSPFEVVQGTINSFSLEVPWRRLQTEPVVLKIDGLYILCTRKAFTDVRAGSHQKKTIAEGGTANMNEVKRVQQKDEEVRDEGEDGYFSRMLKKVAENMQIKVSNVHICFQDSKSIPDHSFAIGVTIDSFQLGTTDADWVPTKTTNEDVTYKLLSFFNLAIYWDTDLGLSRSVSKQNAAPLLALGVTHYRSRAEHQYIMEPVSGFLKATITHEEGNEGTDSPHVEGELGFKEVNASISANQYRDLLHLTSFLRDWDVALRYTKFRPSQSIHANPTAWWKFAITAVRMELRRRKGHGMVLSDAQQRRTDKKVYIKLFKQKLSGRKLTRLERSVLDVLERKLAYESIVFFRALAQKEQDGDRNDDHDAPSEGFMGITGWLGWPGWNGSAAKNECVLSTDELRKVLESTGTEPSWLLHKLTTSQYYNATGKLHCSVKSFQFIVADWRNDEAVNLCAATVTNIECWLERESRLKRAALSIESITLDDLSSPHTAFTRVIGPVTPVAPGSDKPLFKIDATIRPSESHSDYTVNAKLEPISLIYSRPLVDTMAMFFTRADRQALAKLKQTVLEKMHEVQQRLYAEIRYIVRTQKAVEVDLDVGLPQLFIPEHYDREDSAGLLLDGGHLRVESEPRQREDTEDAAEKDEEREDQQKDERDQSELDKQELKLLQDARDKWRSARSGHNYLQDGLIGEHGLHVKHHLHNISYHEATLTRPAAAGAGGLMWLYDAYAAKLEGLSIYIVPNPNARNVPLLFPVSANLIAEVCALPYKVELPQIVVCGHLSPVRMSVDRDSLFLLARICALSGFLEEEDEGEAEVRIKRKRAKAALSVHKKKRRGVMDLADIVSEDDMATSFKIRKQTKEKLTKCVLLNAQVTIPQVELELRYRGKEGDPDGNIGLLRAELREAALGGVMGLYHMDTQLRMGVISVLDKQGGAIVSCDKNVPFISCKIRNIARTSIEYQYVDYLVDLQLSPCTIVIHQDIVIAFIKTYYFANIEASKYLGLVESQVTISEPKKDDLGDTDTGYVSSYDRLYADADSNIDDADMQVWEIKSRLTVKCDILSVQLCTASQDIGMFEMRGFLVEGDTQGATFDVRAGMSSISIRDQTVEGARYRPVLDSIGKGASIRHRKGEHDDEGPAPVILKDEEWAAFRAISYDPNKPDWPGHHYAVSIRLSPFRYVFLMQFLNHIRRFMFRIQVKSDKYAKQLLQMHKKQGLERKVEKHKKEKAESAAPRFVKFDVLMTAPQLIIPRSAVADDVVIIHLRQISMSNWFDIDEDHGVSRGVLNEHIALQVFSLMPHTATLASLDAPTHSTNTRTRPVMENPIDLMTRIVRPRAPDPNSDKYDSIERLPIRVEINTAILPLVLNRTQYNNLLLVIKHNINESVVGPPPAPPRSTSQERWSELELAFRMDAAILHLFDEKSDPFPFGHLGLEHVALEAIYYSDMETDMRILTHSFVLSTAVGGRGTSLKEMFRTEYSDPLTDQFELLVYHASATGIQEITIAVDSPRLYLILEKAAQVVNFITPSDDPDVAAPQPSINTIEPWVPVNTLSVSMLNAEILIMTDFSKDVDPHGMVMYTDATITWQASADNCQKLTVKLRSIRAGVKSIIGPPTTHAHHVSSAEPERKPKPLKSRMIPKIMQEAHLLEGQRGLTHKRKMVMESIAAAHQEIRKAMGKVQSVGEPIMEYVTIEVHANLVQTPGGCSTVLVNMDPLEITLRSRTLNTLAHVSASMNEALKTFSGSSAPPPPSRPRDVQYAAASGMGGHDDVMALATTQKVARTAPPYIDQPAGISGMTQLIVQTQGVRLALIDDYTRDRLNAPLFAVKLDTCAAKISIGNMVNVRLDLVLEAQYFNSYLAVWEPVIEPWQCKVLMQQSSFMALDVTSVDLLNVNLTPGLVESITNTLKPWTEMATMHLKENAKPQYQSSLQTMQEEEEKRNTAESSSSQQLRTLQKQREAAALQVQRAASVSRIPREAVSEPSQIQLVDAPSLVPHTPSQVGTGVAPQTRSASRRGINYSPFWVHNLAGCTVRYRLEKTGGGLYGEFASVEPGGTNSVPINANTIIDLDENTLQKMVLVVDIAEGSYDQMIYVPLHRVCEYDYELSGAHDAPGGGFSVKIVCRVRPLEGSKVIEIQSPLVIENHTNVAVEVALDLPAALSHPSIRQHQRNPQPHPIVPVGTIEPHTEAAPVPLPRVPGAKLRIRPFVRPTYEPEEVAGWSLDIFDPTNAPDEMIVRCPPSFYCRFVIHKRSPNIVIKICPVVEIYNFLPCNLQYELTPTRLRRESELGEERKKVFEGEITNEQKLSITTAYTEEKFALAIKIPDHTWSKPLYFDDTKDRDELRFFKVQNTHGTTLHLNVVMSNYHGTRRIEIFNQYWVYNQTGLPLVMQRKKSLFHLNNENDQQVAPEQWYSTLNSSAILHPIMMSFPKPDSSQNKVTLGILPAQPGKVSRFAWSNAFSLKNIGERGLVKVECTNRDDPYDPTPPHFTKSYSIGMSVDLAPNQRTKIVTLWPRFVLVNSGQRTVQVGQTGTSHLVTVEPGERVPFLHWTRGQDCFKFLRVRYTDTAAWSASFDVMTIGEETLKLQEVVHTGISTLTYLNVHKILHKATVFVVFNPQRKASYFIDNQTELTLKIAQQGNSVSEVVPPESMVPYAWDYPLYPHRLEVKVDGTNFVGAYRLNKLKAYPVRNITVQERIIPFSVSVVSEEGARVLRITSNPAVLPQAEEEVDTHFMLNLRAIGISVVDSKPQELLYVTLDTIKINYSNSDMYLKLEAKVGDLQIDNQLTDYTHPVMLASVKDTDQPFLQFSVVKSNQITSITYVHYLCVLIQEMDVRIEERMIYRLMDFGKALGLFGGKGSDQENEDEEEAIPGREALTFDVDDLKEHSDSLMYFDLLMFNSMKVILTFNVSPGSKKESKLVRGAHNLGFAIGSFHQAPIKLNALVLRHVYGTMEDIQQPIQKHYTQQALGEAYKVVGTFDFLGNPVGLFHNLATGFHDFFVEPSKGIIKSPEDFKAGLQKGSLSLVKHTIYGLTNSASKLSATAARGLATLSMDKAYLEERDLAIRETPNNAGEGVIQGARSLRAGVSHGVTGLVMLPIEGARKEGALGVAKGIPKGIAGLVVKPIAGVFDLFSMSSEGVRNSSRPTPARDRRRTPRYFPPDGSLLIYEQRKSYGHYLLSAIVTNAQIGHKPYTLDDGEEYRFHIIWRNSNTLVYTNKRVICLADPRGLRKKWEIWISNIASIKASKSGVKFELKNPVSKKPYSMSKTNKRVFKCTESSAQHFIYQKTLQMLQPLESPQTDPHAHAQLVGSAAQ